MTPLRLHIVRTHWTHWGAYAGIVRYLAYLPPAAFVTDDHPTFHEDETAPGRRRRVWEWMRWLVRRRGVPWYTLYDLRSEFRTARRIAAGRVDVLHYLDPEHGMQYLPRPLRRLPRRLRPGVVATFHQPPDLLAKVVRRDIASCLDHVTVVSPDQEAFLRDYLPGVPITFIPHGVDADFFVPAASRDEGRPWTCLTVGHNLRDFDAIRAVSRRLRQEPGIRFEVIARQAEALTGLPNVTVKDSISDLELRRSYQAASVLLLPLRGATANNALLEGFACGLPTITTDLAAVRAYAPGHEAILVRGNDPDDIVDNIRRLRENESLAQNLGAAARRRAEALSWPRIAPAYASLYRGIAAAQPATGALTSTSGGIQP